MIGGGSLGPLPISLSISATYFSALTGDFLIFRKLFDIQQFFSFIGPGGILYTWAYVPLRCSSFHRCVHFIRRSFCTSLQKIRFFHNLSVFRPGFEIFLALMS